MIISGFVTLNDPTADLQAAIDAALPGTELRLAPGVYTAPTAAGWILNKPISIVGPGAGLGDHTVSATLSPYVDPVTGTKNSRVLTIASNRVRVEGLSIGPASAPASDGTGDGVYFEQTGGGSVVYFGVILRDLNIANMGRDGVHLVSSGSNFLNDVLIEKVESDTNRACGFLFEHCGSVHMSNCIAMWNRAQGVRLNGQGNCRLYGCYLQGNMQGGNGYDVGAQMYASTSHDLVISGMAFEDFSIDANTLNALTLDNCRSATVESCQFLNNTASANGAISIRIVGGTQGCYIGPCAHDYVSRTISVGVESEGAGVGSNRGNWYMAQNVNRHDTNNPGLMVVPNQIPTSVETTSSGYDFLVVPISGNYANDTSGKRGSLGGLRFPCLANVAGAIGSEVDGATPDSKYEGTFIYNAGLHSPGFYNGSKWALMNNVPKRTNAQIAALTWAPGDIVWNTDTNYIVVYSGTAWKNVVSMA